MRILPFLLLPVLVLSAGTGQRHKRGGGPVSTSKEAKRIAEQETGGRAVSANRVPLNGASGGWEVDVHMPKDSRGWRCIIDADTHSVYTKTRIDNPGTKHR
ncbi:MAG: PepSY domain-containing protein [Acidobacteria bacterium]|nr:PepSY domain-containing protein [Acidobacteriota bacterium]